ncbi:MAG: LPS export ABC transporter periplasmic protein LptC [Sphingobacteriales bacterium]|nr:LPS export ABC transporter periplasmic protein LptC [Sphingobacteriales bacterium]OJW32459.1 MAG: LPS export ABC transporter periplasmic protein LptC [Sphingobacteriales bacterium 46-32]
MKKQQPFYRMIFRSLLPVLAGSVLLYSCENSQAEIDAYTKRVQMQEVAQDVESYLSQAGKMKARLKAPLMYRVMSDSQYLEFPNSLHVDFYDDSTRVETWLDSKYGKYFENLDKVYLRDSVVIVTVKGDTLRCHDLWWDQNKAIFYTDSVATYRSPGNNISGGRGMEATQDLKTVTFRSPLGDMVVSSSGFAEAP